MIAFVEPWLGFRAVAPRALLIALSAGLFSTRLSLSLSLSRAVSRCRSLGLCLSCPIVVLAVVSATHLEQGRRQGLDRRRRVDALVNVHCGSVSALVGGSRGRDRLGKEGERKNKSLASLFRSSLREGGRGRERAKAERKRERALSAGATEARLGGAKGRERERERERGRTGK